jgi:valacyclovir hydrolase
MPQVQVNGAGIYYEALGMGEPLLLLPAMLETGRTHARLILRLSGQYRVIAPDLRGYGQSKPRPRDFPVDFYQRDADDMAALLAALDLTGVRVLGNGDGAEVALLLALTAPERIRAVVGLSVTGAFPPQMRDVLPGLGAWIDELNPEDRIWRSEMIREYGREGLQAIWNGWTAAIEAMLAQGGNISLAQAGNIGCPVLIVNGLDDDLNTPAMSQALADAIPHADLHLVPDVGQFILDRNLGLFSNLVVEWFARH